MKVSIIVIIYKVSEYLAQCLESIINQTYKNIEIICVVGSDDEECMRITSEYAEKDKRIVFLPKKAEGTAKARNSGLDAATGDLIEFVDGDDYIENDMVETLVTAMMEENADISIVSKYYLYKNTVDGINNEGRIVYSGQTLMQDLLKDDGFFLHLWDKLFKKEVFQQFRFKEGSNVCEDRQLCFDILCSANKVVYTPKSKYYFRQSLDSGSRIYGNAEDSLSEDYSICNKLRKMYPDLDREIDFFLVKENISVIQSSMLYDVFSRKHDKERIDFVKSHMFNAMKSRNASKGIIVKMFMCIICPEVLKKMTKKRRAEFLNTHEHFSNGTDWESIFKKQGIKF